MKAILAHAFGGPEVLKYEEADDPKAGPGEVVIDIKAAGINPADTYMRGGAYAIKPDLPYTPGGDAAGVVAEIGHDVTEFAIGDAVFVGVAIVTSSALHAVLMKAPPLSFKSYWL